MVEKKKWADDLIKGLAPYCALLCDPKDVWEPRKGFATGVDVFWNNHSVIIGKLNGVMSSETYKNVKQGGSSSKYLKKVQDEISKVMSRSSTGWTDPENLKSSMQSCGEGLSKLKHPNGSNPLVKVGDKGKRIVDYVDELARLMLNKTVQENAAKLMKLLKNKAWPADDENYTYERVETKYVEL